MWFHYSSLEGSCAHASHATGHKIANTSLEQPLGLNESKSQKAIAVIVHRKRLTVAPESFAIARSLQQEDFGFMKFSVDCGKQPRSLFQRRQPLQLSFLQLLTYFLGEGRRELFPNTKRGYLLFSFVYWAECTNVLTSFTYGQRNSPHCYTLYLLRPISSSREAGGKKT